MAITVWMAAWQLDCCGEPFAVGARVSWPLRHVRDPWLAGVLGPAAAVTVDAEEDHHGGGDATAHTVTGIRQVHCRFDPAPVPGSGLLTEVGDATRWVGDRGDRQFAGFLVRLSRP